MATQIALLRGVNVGAHNRLPMAELRAHLTSLGYGDVRTLLQSGNVVLDTDASPDHLAADLQRELADRFDVRSPVVVRTRAQLAKVVALDPLREVVTEDKLYQVSFLSARPAKAAIAQVVATEPERFVHSGQEIYAWHPKGIHSSPLAKLLSDGTLGVLVTARNWRTTVKLLELASEHER